MPRNSRTFPSAIRAVSSARLTSLLLLAFFLEVGVGTWIEARGGLWEARRLVFENWFWGIPLLSTVAGVNLCAALAARLRWTWRNAGLLLSHLGLFVLVVSGALNLAFSRSADVELGAGETVDAAVFRDRWEVALQQPADSGLLTVSVPLDKLPTGRAEPMGGLSLRLVERVANGSSGMGGRLAALPRTGNPEQDIPAVAIRLEDGTGLDVVLDRFHPASPLAGRRIRPLRRDHLHLPFRLRLDSFRRETHPGSTRPKSFESALQVGTDGSWRRAVVRMNHPLRLGAFTLYQASWKSDPSTGEERTVISVVENPSAAIPYAACILVGIGLLVHFARGWRFGGSKLAVLALLLSAAGARAATVPEVPAEFGGIPVQIDGRVKSLETFASHTLLQASGRTTVDGLSAPRWLAAMIFDPARIQDIPVVLVENPDVRDALGLVGKERDRYPWKEFRARGRKLNELAQQASGKEAQSRDVVDREILRLSDVWYRMSALENAFVFLRPSSVPPAPQGIPAPASFLGLALRSGAYARILDSLERLDPAARTASVDSCLFWFHTTFQATQGWADAQFPVVPVPGRPERPWESPASKIALEGLRDRGFAADLVRWQGMRDSWFAGDPAKEALAARSIDSSLRVRAGTSLRAAALRAESLYNRAQPFGRAGWLYLLAFLSAGLFAWKKRRGWDLAATVLVSAGWGFSLAGMAMRMVVTLRPPVTNLHETFLFVSVVTVPVFLWAAFARAWRPGVAFAAASGAGLLLLARGFGADGDTMPVLVAVLDSNLWLTVHVLTITVGYAGVVVAGLAAHWHLYQLRRGRNEGFPVVRSTLAFGLFFTFVGTLLGGIWADQSWGRFWGWDPKENGALMIALWCALLFHARHAGWIREKGFSVGAALSIATVLFAWFGVNLLGVGLHSYGFTEGTLRGLAAYAVLEAGFLGWALAGRKTS